MSILVLNDDAVRRLLPMQECISIMEQAFSALARGRVFQPIRSQVRPPEAAGIMVVMPSYLSYGEDAAYYGLKAICVFHGNTALGKDAHQGAVLLYSGETGELLALMNASSITAIRTAAVSGLATRLLARPDAEELALVGAGVQARTHLQAMHAVRALRRVRVVGRSLDSARRFAAEHSEQFPFPIEPVASVEEALAGADLIVTATTAAEPLLRRDWIAPGAHINLVGAYTPTSREADTATLRDAALFVDRRESALSEAGDILIPIQEGAFGPEHIRAELGELVTGQAEGRTSDNELTVFKSLGLPVEDLAAAEYLYRKALEHAEGVTVDY